MQFKAPPSNLRELRNSQVKFNEMDLRLIQQNNKLQKDIKELEIVCATQFDSINQLTTENDSLNQQLIRKDTELERYQLQEYNILKMREELGAKIEIVVNQEGEIDDLTKKVNKLQDELLEMKKNQKFIVEVKQSVIEDKNNTKDQLEQKIRDLEKQLLIKTQALLKLQEKKRIMKEQYEKQLKQQLEYINQLENELEQYLQEKEGKDKLLNKLIKQNQQQKLEIESLLNQISILQQSKDIDPQDIKYMIENTNLRNQKLHLSQELAKHEHQITVLQNSNALLTEQLNTIGIHKIKIDKLSNEIIQLEKENENLKSKNRAEQYQIEQQILQITDKEQQLKDLSYQLELKQINLHQMIKYTQGMKEENEQLNYEIDQYQLQISELRKLYEDQQLKHEEEQLILNNKSNIKALEVNNKILKQIPIQINSPYDIPKFKRHYL